MRNKNIFWSDTETTGFSPTKDNIVEIAILLQNVESGEIKEFHQYIKYDFYPEHYQKVCDTVHGLYPELLETKGVTSIEANENIKKFLIKNGGIMGGMEIAGYNVGFDKNFLDNFFLLKGFPVSVEKIFTKKLDVLDTVKRARTAGLLPDIENLKLPTVAEYLDVQYEAHSAMADIKTTKYIYDYLTLKLKGVK